MENKKMNSMDRMIKILNRIINKAERGEWGVVEYCKEMKGKLESELERIEE